MTTSDEFNNSDDDLADDQREEDIDGNPISELDENLIIYASNNMVKEFLECLERGANINIISDIGNSILHWAVSHSAVDVAMWVANNSERLNLNLDYQDIYPWQVDDEYFDEMFGKGRRPINIEDPFKWTEGDYLKNTALILAVKKGWNHICTVHGDLVDSEKEMGNAITALLENGADPNVQDACGNTALHIAFLTRDIRSIELLLKHGARLDIQNNGGLKPEDLLDVRYKDVKPFLYVQTGNDKNCYIHTMANRLTWAWNIRAAKALADKYRAQAITPSSVLRPQP